MRAVLSRGLVVAAACLAATLASAPAEAQRGSPIGYGISERFAAARDLLVLGVQQAISDLPPSSGQTFTYEYDAAIDAWVRSDRLGPTSFFAPETVGRGVVDLRVAGSYFELGQSFRPIDYEVEGADGSFLGWTKAGLDVSARVGVISLAATYGVLPDLDLSLTLPITLVDASSAISITTCKPEAARAVCATPPDPPIYDARVVSVRDRARIDAPGFLRGEDPAIFQRSGSASEFAEGGSLVPFDEGTQAGVGRVALAAKKSFQGWSILRAAVFGQIALPSPSSEEFAGSDSTGLMLRAIGAANVSESLRILADAGYEYDTELRELSRFVWDVGAAWSLAVATLDLGIGGSIYEEAIDWTPSAATTLVPETGGTITLRAAGDNESGTVYVAVRTGARVRLTENATLSGTVTVPVDDDTFSPDAVGTLAVDVAF